MGVVIGRAFVLGGLCPGCCPSPVWIVNDKRSHMRQFFHNYLQSRRNETAIQNKNKCMCVHFDVTTLRRENSVSLSALIV